MKEIRNTISTISEEVRHITHPLMRESSINYFGLVRVFPDGGFINLVSDPVWSEYHYLEKGLPPVGLLNYNSIKDNTFILLNEHSDALAGWPVGSVLELNERFNLLNSFVIVKKHANFLESYGFTTSLPNSSEFFLNNFHFLESFNEYVKDKADHIIQAASKNPIYYQKSNAKLATFPEKPFPSIENKHYVLYADHLTVRITKREYDVLSFLARGYKIKQAAALLQISPRTVDEYVLNLRKKFNTSTINKVIKIYWENKSFLG